MSARRIIVLLLKEVSHGTRNFIFLFATVIPVTLSLFLSLVFGDGSSGAPRVGIIDEGMSRLPALFEARDYLETRRYQSAAHLRGDVERGAVEMGIIIPPGFDDAVRDGSETTLTIYFWGEGQVTDRGTLVTALASAIVEVSGLDVPVTVEPVILGGGEVASWSERLLPLLVLMTIILGGTLVPAVSLVEEKQKRTLVALTTTPASLSEVLVAKALLGVGVSLAMGALILTINQAFGTRPLLLLLLLMLGAVAAAELGILLGTLTGDLNGLFAVIKSLGLILYAPAIIELVPQLPRWLAEIFPTYYIISPIQEVALNGAGVADIAGQIAILVVLALVMVAAVWLLLAWQERRAVVAG